MIQKPVIDQRTSEEIIRTAQALRLVYTPEWTTQSGDSGTALISIFARLMEIVTDRLNRVPEKHFLAFLDTAGVHLLPPKAARVPVKFIATTGAKKDGVVPAGTQLATAPPQGQAPLTFETEKRLTVSRLRLAYLVSHDPNADQYTDQKDVVASNEKNELAPFQPFAGTVLIPHRLYLSHDRLFRINHPTTLTLQFTLDSVSDEVKALFKSGLRWIIASSGTDITPRPEDVDVSGNPIKVPFSSSLLRTIDTRVVDGLEACWLKAETKIALSRGVATTKIMSVTATSSATDIKPSIAFFNTAPLDTNREFYPFGEKPKTFDTFFLAVPEAFTKTGGRITLQPGYNKRVAGASGVELTYEFWNGSAWKTLGVMNNTGTVTGTVNNTYVFTDTTNAFTDDPTPSKYIKFNCPEMKPVEVNGKTNNWLRVRITSGNYGEEAKMELTVAGKAKQRRGEPLTLNDWTYSPISFYPPIVTSLTASYEYSSPQSMTAARTENNFAFASVDLTSPTKAFKPFAAPEENQPACYLGFDSPFSPDAVSVYVDVEEAVLVTKPVVVWEYWNGTQWRNLGVKDGTTNFTESGMVEFMGPADAGRKELFGTAAYWLRARLEQGEQSLIRILGLYLNTVWAKHCVTITLETIGSSSETPRASYKLSRLPVLDGVQIEVREPERPSDEDLVTLFAEEGSDAVSDVRQGEGNEREKWVRWHQIDHFLFSKKNSRHYVADWFNGGVQFGDGIRGMVPPAGRGNIRAKWYRAGGGANGNVARNTVTVLKRAIPFVDKAFNVDAAGGGADGETVDYVKVRGPQSIKNRGRAVTWEDYEWLAKEASFQVARTRCLPARSKDDAGTVTLILVPWSDDPEPYPSQGLIRQVKDYVSTRMRRIATADLVIIGPKYVEISVSANVIPKRLEEADLVRRRVKEKLTEFFHPLRGGPDKNGWEFGRDVFVSEISKVIEDTEGVDHAEAVEICSSFYDDGRAAISMPSDHDLTRLIYQVDIGEDYLVASGDHLIALNGISEPNLIGSFLGNRSTKELHNLRNQQTNCQIGLITAKGHARSFLCLSQPIREGYDFCAWCFGRNMSQH